MARFARFAKGRNLPGHRRGEMNTTEAKYEREVLIPAKEAGLILAYEFESQRLQLAKLTYWTPDFVVLLADLTIEFIDVKGTRIQDEQAQRVKVKIAAEKYWYYRFKVAKQQTRKQGGGFKDECFYQEPTP